MFAASEEGEAARILYTTGMAWTRDITKQTGLLGYIRNGPNIVRLQQNTQVSPSFLAALWVAPDNVQASGDLISLVGLLI